MKRLTSILLALVFALSIPVAVAAMSHEKHEHGMKMEHGDMKHGDMKKGDMKHGDMKHGDMKHGDMKHGAEKMSEGHGEVMEHAKEKAHEMHEGHGKMNDMHDMHKIGEAVEDGVKGTAKIMAYSAEHADMANATHHLMIDFVDTATSKPVTAGTVAVKVKAHGGEKTQPIELMQMDQGFGADLKLEPGHYEIEVGTKLADGEKRKFEYEYMVK